MRLTTAPEYIAWVNMRKRCHSPTVPNFKYYGGRGITVCERWSSFTAFYDDMGPRPDSNYTLGRIDNDKGYSANNCRWETRLQQQRNTRLSKKWIFRGLVFDSSRQGAAHFQVDGKTFRTWVRKAAAQ